MRTHNTHMTLWPVNDPDVMSFRWWVNLTSRTRCLCNINVFLLLLFWCRTCHVPRWPRLWTPASCGRLVPPTDDHRPAGLPTPHHPLPTTGTEWSSASHRPSDRFRPSRRQRNRRSESGVKQSPLHPSLVSFALTFFVSRSVSSFLRWCDVEFKAQG